MGTKLPPRELELYRSIDEILWKEWDPIGNSGTPQARAEYQGYLPTVFKFAVAGDRVSIAEYLHWAVGERMGLTSTIAQQMPIADRIVKVAAELRGGANDT